MNKKVIIVVLLILFCLIIYLLGQQLANSLQADYRLDREMDKFARLQRENQQLRNQLKEVQSLRFLEEQARDKLNLSRVGETIIIIPQEQIEQVLKEAQKTEEIKLPNWQGWLKLFWSN